MKCSYGSLKTLGAQLTVLYKSVSWIKIKWRSYLLKVNSSVVSSKGRNSLFGRCESPPLFNVYTNFKGVSRGLVLYTPFQDHMACIKPVPDQQVDDSLRISAPSVTGKICIPLFLLHEHCILHQTLIIEECIRYEIQCGFNVDLIWVSRSPRLQF